VWGGEREREREREIERVEIKLSSIVMDQTIYKN
jgi:hypothetical protein